MSRQTWFTPNSMPYPGLILNARSPRRTGRDITQAPPARRPHVDDRARSPQPEWSGTLGSKITLTASDGFKLGGYRAEPQGKAKGGMVVIQEIFGVNHFRGVGDRGAALG